MDLRQKLAKMDPIKFAIKVAVVEENKVDVIVAGEPALLKAFQVIYNNVFYLENSRFGFPIVIVPNFTQETQAKVWKEYWDVALSDPKNSCNSCHSIKQFFSVFLAEREKLAAAEENKN